MISSHLRRVIGTFRRSCAVCQTDKSSLDRSYSNQVTSLIGTIHRNNLTIQSKSDARNKTHNAIRNATSNANNGNTSTKDTEKPIQKPKKFTTLSMASKKRRGEKITMVTAYDFPSAVHVDRAGVDVLLVGDSCAMVELGFETTQVCMASIVSFFIASCKEYISHGTIKTLISLISRKKSQ